MYSVYQVMPFDTLESIANKTNTTVDKLREINSDLNVKNGSYIIVPRYNDEIFTTYIVKSGDSLYQLAKKYNITVDDLAGLNGLNKNDYIYPNQEIVVPTGKAKIYITKNGDTIDNITKKFGTSYDNIVNQNKKIYLLPDQLIIFEEENL